jgi:peptidoglycan/xylan/chitin deacetylase (PgdA/CDA1 family)
LRGGPRNALANARRRAAYALGRPVAFALERAARSSARRVGVALVYHRVGDPPGDLERELLPALGASLLAAQVRYLAATYRVVPASELLESTRGRRRGERFPVAITFDDDLRSHLDVTAPLLAQAGVPATFFLCGASLEAPGRFWWERLQEAYDDRLDLTEIAPAGRSIHELGRAVEAMSPEQRGTVDAALRRLVGPDPPDAGLRAEEVAKLARGGFELGFHTLSHDPLPDLGDGLLERALRTGRARLEQAAGVGLHAIAYPHGSADERVAAAAREAGFRLGFTGNPEPVTPESDPLLLGRLSPSYDSVGELALRIAWAIASSGTSR